MKGFIHNGVSRIPWIDPASHALMTIDAHESVLHRGYHFIATYSVDDLGAMTTPDDAITLSFTTPDTTTRVHMRFEFEGSAGALCKLIEGKTGAGATPTGTIQSYNSERNSAIVSALTDVAGINASKISYDATLFTGGTELWSQYLSGAKSSGGAATTAFALVLKKGTLYQFSLYNAAANPGSINLAWNEGVHKDE